jgi:hypothetical protein
VNKGILLHALSGRVDLELEYREPSHNETGMSPQDLAAGKLERTHALMQIADAFAWVLHVMN